MVNISVTVTFMLLAVEMSTSKNIKKSSKPLSKSTNMDEESSSSSKREPTWILDTLSWRQGGKFKTKTPSVYKEDAMAEDFRVYLQTQARSPTNRKSKGKNTCKTFFSCISFPKRFLSYFTSVGQPDLSNLGQFTTDPLVNPSVSVTTKNIGLRSRKVSAYLLKFNDPMWRKQWYVQDYRTINGPVMDHNVVPVYDLGYTGKDVIVAIVDRGITHGHPDLAENLDLDLSFDYCNNKPGCDTKDQPLEKMSHGTNAAGVVGMVANNGLGGVGIAHKATLLGVKLFCRAEATEDAYIKALTHRYDLVDIYSNSWGPPDDPTKISILTGMIPNAFKKGVKEGRNKKGAIYLFSSGNGGDRGDNCAADGYINRVEVIAIGSANQDGRKSDFSERCSAVFAVTYSGNRKVGIGYKEAVVAPVAGGGCIDTFSGTSASAPIAAGIIALALQSNPELTYRDVMHLIAMSSEVAPLADNRKTWYKNGRDFWVSLDFGFGLINAKNMVKLADKTKWQRVPDKHTCIFSVSAEQNQQVSGRRKATIPFKTNACANFGAEAIRFLEHIEITPDIEYPKRGGISLYITSPTGTRSTILEYREKDISSDRLNGMNIVSVHHWGEDPRGDWTIEVIIDPTCYAYTVGKVHGFKIKFHGTYEMPDHYKSPRVYASFRTPDGKSSP